jgi:hypothetical protein
MSLDCILAPSLCCGAQHSFCTTNSPCITYKLRGFHHFDHLQKLSLPAHILCNKFCVCLGELQGLQKLMIMVTSFIPVLSPAARYSFSVLCTLKIKGSKALSSDLVNAFLAFVNPHNLTIRKVVLEAVHLSCRGEMKDILSIFQDHVQIKKLEIHIHGIHGSEEREWMDLSLLSSLPNLSVFTITHTWPLPLKDNFIVSLVTVLPSAKVLLFNPCPTLPPWDCSPKPMLNCLAAVEKEGSNLCHFRIYLDPHAPYDQHTFPSRTRMEELNLGEIVVSSAQASQLQLLFPKVK